MKPWMKIVIGIVIVITLAISGILYLTAGVVQVGDDFFAAVKAGDMDKAYSTLSVAFRAETSDEELRAYLSASRMDKVSETSWGNRSISSGRGKLVGTLTTTDGGTVPVEIDLIKEQDQWKIYALRTTAQPAGVGYGPKNLPSENQQLALIAESVGIFADAVTASDMTVLHDHISRMWASQVDVEQLSEGFASFYKHGKRIQIVKQLAPVYESPPKLSEQGIMELQLYYPVAASTRLHFRLKYIFEGTGWKLFGLSVHVS